MQLKWKLFNTLSGAACRVGALTLMQRWYKHSGNEVAVLTYHRIADTRSPVELDPTLASATPETFAAQLDYLGEHFTFVSAADVLAASRGEKNLPANALLLSFDDAYDDFASAAWPELKVRQIPAVLFVPTGYATDPQRKFWWDDLHYWLLSNKDAALELPEVSATPLVASKRSTRKRIKSWLKSLDPTELETWVEQKVATQTGASATNAVLPWPALRELAAEGLELCPHSVTHPIMTRLDDAAVHAEIEESYEQLAAQTKTTLPVFAYPSGYTDDRVSAACAATSMELAFTTRFGLARLQQDNHWQLNRISVSGSASAQALRLMALSARYRR